MEVLGLDHIYLSVSNFERSEEFYDRVMRLLGFRKGDKPIAGEPHAHYFNRTLQLTIRPARRTTPHDPYAPGLHHLCLQMPGDVDVDAAAQGLRELGYEPTQPQRYPEYHPDYYATFLCDPDGIRLELVSRTSARSEIAEHWDEFDQFLNPLAAYHARQS
jgi:glyoxylase I family protein